MQLAVSHLVTYRYSRPVISAIQLLRLTPGRHDGQSVLRWRVRGAKPSVLPSYVDGHGNLVHTNSINRPHQSSTVLVEGAVETRETGGRIEGAAEPLPPPYFLRVTPATAADAALAELAAGAARGGRPLDRLVALLEQIRERVPTAAVDPAAGAAEALAHGFGTAQDQVHLFLAACRLLGVPARFIGGYLPTGAGGQWHNWAEAFVGDLGWIGFDPIAAAPADAARIRVAVGLDAASAAPIHGVRRGAADETLAVTLKIAAAESAQ